MVTKRSKYRLRLGLCLILAKIHMVTKLFGGGALRPTRLILAKIHMVTKRKNWFGMQDKSLILAKIHMVTKLMLKI